MRVEILHDIYSGVLTASQQKRLYLMATSTENQQKYYKTGFCKKSGNGASIGECTDDEITTDWFDGATYQRYIIWFFRDPANKCQWKYHKRYSTNDLSTLKPKLRQTILTLLDTSAPCTGHQVSTAEIKTTAAATTTTTVTTKAAATTKTLPADGRCPIVIDVRTQAEWDAGHASCAHRLEIQYKPDLVTKVLSLAKGDKTHPVQLYCRSGNRAGKAKGILQDKQWTHVTNAGGWQSGQMDSIKKLCECTSSVITLVISGQACDTSASGYLQSSPGFVDSLAACAKSCQASSQCMSITFYASKWCSHFSSKCTRLVGITGATTLRFEAGARAEGWALAGDGKECDSGAGEVYLKTSPGNGGTLAQCLTSCGKSASGCKSITFYQNGWCSHFSSACTKTKAVANAVAFSRADSTTN